MFASSGKLRADLTSCSSLTKRDRDAMWEVFQRYYTSISRVLFEQDLSEKDRVILLRDSGDHSIQGFSTIKVYDQKIKGRRVVAIFSGDTIVERQYWGQSALHWAFFSFLLKVKVQNPVTPVFWFLISKGYKTYLLLARNVPNHWPRYSRETPSFEKEVLDELSARRYGKNYNPETGTLSFEESHGQLRDKVAPIYPKLLSQPDIRFFVDRNPHHADGDELCCLGRIDSSLLSYSLKRLLGRPFRRLQRQTQTTDTKILEA